MLNSPGGVSGIADRSDFRRLQAGLAAALAANRPGSGVEHVVIAMPSFSVGESLLSHYANRIAALEHRYLLGSLLLGRIESCEYVFVSSAAPCAWPSVQVSAGSGSAMPQSCHPQRLHDRSQNS